MVNDTGNIENESNKELSEFARSIQNKQFRFSDWFAEKVIRTVAFFSIAFVLLIFMFVFRETLPIFKQNGQNKENKLLNDDILIPETYTGEENAGAQELKQEVYTGSEDVESEDQLVPEIYTGDTNSGSLLQPEQYGVITQDTGYTSNNTEQTGQEEYLTAEISEKEALGTLSSKDWQPISDRPRYGLLPLILGTLKITLIAIFFAAPISIFAALYTAMFAPKQIREYIKPIIELLAGFPSVVIGFFALMILATFFQDLFGYSSRLNAFVGGIAMSLAAIPVIYTLTEDALSSVPKTFIEASLGLGASIRQTAFSIILPAATPGIFAAILLGIGRVFGETMIALMATGNASLITLNPFDSVRTLSATIGAEMAEVVFGDTHYSILFLIGSLLFIFTFILNALAEFYFKNKIIKRIQGK